MRKKARGSTRSYRSPTRRAGFSIMELLVVMFVIGVVSAIAVPQFDLGKRRVDAAMQTAGATLVAAQRLAVSRQHDVRVSFDVAGGRMLIHEDADGDGAVDADEAVRTRWLEDGVQFGLGAAPARALGGGPVSFSADAAGRPTVVFRRNGSTTEVGVIYLTGSAGDAEASRALEVERGTSRVTWYRYGGSEWVLGF